MVRPRVYNPDPGCRGRFPELAESLRDDLCLLCCPGRAAFHRARLALALLRTSKLANAPSLRVRAYIDEAEGALLGLGQHDSIFEGPSVSGLCHGRRLLVRWGVGAGYSPGQRDL
ncbi:unnamed protein product, partial [Symbiodinium pilosum]